MTTRDDLAQVIDQAFTDAGAIYSTEEPAKTILDAATAWCATEAITIAARGPQRHAERLSAPAASERTHHEPQSLKNESGATT